MAYMKVPEERLAFLLKPEVDFGLQRAFSRILFWGISGTDQDIFTKFDMCVEKWEPQHAEWFQYAFTKNAIG